MKNEIQEIKAQIEAAAKSIASGEALEDFRIQFLSKNGKIPALFKQMKTLDRSEMPIVGKLLNELQVAAKALIKEKQSLKSTTKGTEEIDLTLPGRVPKMGKKHPLTQVREEMKQIFAGMGFTVASGPEVETDFRNFEALNIPKLHPARNMQDTLYITEELLLRTHTSPVQIRTMQTQQPPLRIIAPGRVYRRDTPDATHSPFFHQLEGLCIDEGISMSDLKAVLYQFMQEVFGKKTKLRFRPGFFPFTEPSAEVDIWWESDKGGRWLELLGCGMVHPNVLENVGYDPEKYSGWAFGIGIDRIAMMRYGINDIRLFFENDMRFLEQF